MIDPDPLTFYGKPLVFKPSSHRYSWDGKAVPGVTTILGRIAKPQLIPWAARMAVDHIRTMCPANESGYRLVTDSDLDDACVAHSRIRDVAGNDGTQIHAFAAAMLNQTTPPKLENDVQIRAATAFEDWLSDNAVEVLAVERRVFSLDNWFAGTFDLLARINGELAIVDLKTSLGIYPEHWLQLAGYAIALCEETGVEVAGHHIIHVDKVTGVVTPHLSSDVDGSRGDAFAAATVIHKTMNALAKNNRKPRT